MRNRLLKLLYALMMCCTMGALAMPAVAQEGRAPFGFRIQFGPDVERLVRQAENDTSRFAAMVDERDRSWLSERARELESQLNMVSTEFDRTSSYDRRSQVDSVLRVAESISNAMRYRRMDFDVQRQWARVRSDLNRLARAYSLRQIY